MPVRDAKPRPRCAAQAISLPRSESRLPAESLATFRKVERNRWWLWVTAVTVTLLLTSGIFSVAMPTLGGPSERISFSGLSRSLRGLLGLVLLFDFYCLYQQYQISRIRKRMVENEKLFHLIGEHAVLLRAIRSVLDRAHEKIPTVK